MPYYCQVIPPRIIALLYILFCTCICSNLGSAQSMKFDNFSVENGLSQNSVYSIQTDKKGYLWVGTADGLNRFDGYHFNKYRNSRTDSCTIHNNFIRKLIETPLGNFLIQTDQGIEYFDTRLECFTQILSMADMIKYRISSILVGGDDSVAWSFGSAGVIVKIYIPERKLEILLRKILGHLVIWDLKKLEIYYFC